MPEICPYCGKPVEDSPPNVAFHTECVLAQIMKERDKKNGKPNGEPPKK